MQSSRIETDRRPIFLARHHPDNGNGFIHRMEEWGESSSTITVITDYLSTISCGSCGREGKAGVCAEFLGQASFDSRTVSMKQLPLWYHFRCVPSKDPSAEWRSSGQKSTAGLPAIQARDRWRLDQRKARDCDCVDLGAGTCRVGRAKRLPTNSQERPLCCCSPCCQTRVGKERGLALER